MSLHSPLKLFVGGCGMITTCSIWIFDGQKTPLPEALTSTPPETAEVKQETTEAISTTLTPVVSVQPTQTTPAAPIYLDSFEAVEKLSGWVGETKKDPNIKVVSNVVNTSITVNFEDKPERESIQLSLVGKEIEDFKIYDNSTKKQYKEFEKSSIKISLFKNPAWYSETGEEEYQEIGATEVEKLFVGTDEVKVKQLLLSLHNRLEWKNYHEKKYFSSDVKYADSLNHLTDLKIKYFSEFESLKNYVLAKVATCKTDDRACIPTKWEFEHMETDTEEYFQNIWNSK